MRKAIFFVFLFQSLIVLAIYGGDSATVMTLENCTEATVYVTGGLRIDPGEYGFADCLETDANVWQCGCGELVLTTQPNTINTYTITAELLYADEDNDGVPDHLDLCPGSPSSDVDDNGCTAAQFCSSISVRRWQGVLACVFADWKSNERFPARDCMPFRNTCRALPFAN